LYDDNKEIKTIKYIIEGDNYSRILPQIIQLIKQKYKYTYCKVSIKDDNYNSDNNNYKIIPGQYVDLLGSHYKYPIITIESDDKGRKTIKCEKCDINLVSYGKYGIETANCKHYSAKKIVTRSREERIRKLTNVVLDKRTIINDIKNDTIIVVSANDLDYYSCINYDDDF